LRGAADDPLAAAADDFKPLAAGQRRTDRLLDLGGIARFKLMVRHQFFPD
jgi:hypothetical protein